jgi:hypothetical protein
MRGALPPLSVGLYGVVLKPRAKFSFNLSSTLFSKTVGNDPPRKMMTGYFKFQSKNDSTNVVQLNWICILFHVHVQFFGTTFSSPRESIYTVQVTIYLTGTNQNLIRSTTLV